MEKNVIPVNRSPEQSEGECEESLRSFPEFTLSKHEGLGTRISQSLRSFEMTIVLCYFLLSHFGKGQITSFVARLKGHTV